MPVGGPKNIEHTHNTTQITGLLHVESIVERILSKITARPNGTGYVRRPLGNALNPDTISVVTVSDSLRGLR